MTTLFATLLARGNCLASLTVLSALGRRIQRGRSRRWQEDRVSPSRASRPASFGDGLTLGHHAPAFIVELQNARAETLAPPTSLEVHLLLRQREGNQHGVSVRIAGHHVPFVQIGNVRGAAFGEEGNADAIGP